MPNRGFHLIVHETCVLIRGAEACIRMSARFAQHVVLGIFGIDPQSQTSRSLSESFSQGDGGGKSPGEEWRVTSPAIISRGMWSGDDGLRDWKEDGERGWDKRKEWRDLQAKRYLRMVSRHHRESLQKWGRILKGAVRNIPRPYFKQAERQELFHLLTQRASPWLVNSS